MNILIALDGSTNAHEYIHDLANFPLADDTRVHTIVACDDSILSPHKIDYANGRLIIDEAQDAISSLYPNISVSGDIRSGPAAAQILEVADSFGADFVLAGAHATRPFPKELLGSVAAHLAKHANCSVRLLRPHSQENRVIACLDNTEVDHLIMREINRMNWQKGSVLMLLHVLDSPNIALSYNPREDARLFYKLQEELKERIEISMSGNIKEIREQIPNLEIETSVSTEVEPEAVILDTAKSWTATTIFVGSHRREGLDRFWLGSVSEPVAAKSACSVHIVRRN